MNLRSILFALLLLPGAIFADVVGTYEVRGTDPLSGAYTAHLVVTQEAGSNPADDIYSLVWTFPSPNPLVIYGTGIRKEGVLAVVFFEDGVYGVQEYDIHKHGMEGPWIRYQATEKGHEWAKKISSNPL